ncbi:IMP 5'-nucleotidase [Entomophthora muscae]|nr:IMP 5'-nucleotidase [Entomophthora muscae]
MKLSAKIIRKSRAVGLIPGENVVLSREQLDECVLSTQSYVCKLQNIQVSEGMPRVPFCAFNGGRDAWVDIGNKFFGVEILKKYIGANPEQTIHFGDQFLSTGNDFATRSACCTCWIDGPKETKKGLELLVSSF